MGTVHSLSEAREQRIRALGLWNEPLLSADRLAEKLGVSTRTLYNWRQRGMPDVPYGPRLKRYRLSEVEAWARSLS